MSDKTIAILSYVTIIGWLIAYFKSKDNLPKNALVTYHLKQGLGFFITSLIINVSLSVIVSMMPSLYFLNFIGIFLFIIWIIGIINAVNERSKPLPLIGKVFENKFEFINK